RVAFFKGNDDLLADARDVDPTPLLAAPKRAYSDPARAVGVFCPLPVPEKLHFHPAILVGEDLFSRWPHDNSRLRAIHARPGRLPSRPEGQGRRYAVKRVDVDRPFPLRLGVGPLDAGLVVYAGENVRPVAVEMPVDRELVPGCQQTAIAVPFDNQ